ncbi:hypothetical protein KJ980_05555 [Patescibacteria group bacterium]|nr:hypothetical protein [Patescibacteria group bacterium]MBU4099087.1 hypothetical protein [Patescibacteria group bacterium]
MRKHTFLIFITYVWTKTLIGLTFHPFKSIKGVVRRPILLPVIFSPVMGLAVLFIVGRIAALFVSPHGLKREIVVIFLSTTLLSILFWQLLLFYLLASFLIALRK